jgi:hypothetical protein
LVSPERRIKGPVRARRGSTVRERRSESLTLEAEELLFRDAEILCEGAVRESGTTRSWFGSTMITFDLARLATSLRGSFDPAGLERLARVIDGSVRVRLRATRLARGEVARRLPDRLLGTAQVETRMRLVGEKLQVDVDLEVPLRVSSRARKR